MNELVIGNVCPANSHGHEAVDLSCMNDDKPFLLTIISHSDYPTIEGRMCRLCGGHFYVILEEVEHEADEPTVEKTVSHPKKTRSRNAKS